MWVRGGVNLEGYPGVVPQGIPMGAPVRSPRGYTGNPLMVDPVEDPLKDHLEVPLGGCPLLKGSWAEGGKGWGKTPRGYL